MTDHVFLIAEVGSTHDGSFGNAIRAVDAAAESGVDAVKFQTHIAAAETLPNAPAPTYFKGEPRVEYFERTGFSLSQWADLLNHCNSLGVKFMSSPFSIDAAELLNELGMEHFKIPSGEVTNIPMLEEIAKFGKRVLLSSGMSNWSELDAAVDAILKHNDQLTVLQCTSSYPCEPEEVGLNVMSEMRQRWGVEVGFSDHTSSIYAPIAAATLGATVIEKHFTLSKWMYGSDAWNSLEPHELKQMVEGVRTVERITSNPVDKDDISKFSDMKSIFQKSLVSTVHISSGTAITREMLGEKKPGTGIPAAELQTVVGAIAKVDISKDTLISEDDISIEGTGSKN